MVDADKMAQTDQTHLDLHLFQNIPRSKERPLFLIIQSRYDKPRIPPKNIPREIKYSWCINRWKCSSLCWLEKEVNGKTILLAKKSRDREMFFQIFIITASNVLCWVPSGIVYYLTLVWSEYPTSMLVWTLIAVLPLNSVVNPTFFLLRSFQCKVKTKIYLLNTDLVKLIEP